MKKLLLLSFVLIPWLMAAQILPGRYVLQQAFTPFVMGTQPTQIRTNGGSVQMLTVCEDYTMRCQHQVWEFTAMGPDVFRISLVATGKVLTAVNNTVHLWDACPERTCNNQLWRVRVQNGHISFISLLNNKFLTGIALDRRGVEGTSLSVHECNSNVANICDEQLWYLRPAPEGVSSSLFLTNSLGTLQMVVIKKRYFTRAAVRRLEIAVPADFVVIGGGATGSNFGKGALLTASFPNPTLTAWTISTKSHHEMHAYWAEGYAIGLKIQGLTRAETMSLIQVNSATSAIASHPEAIANKPPNHVFLGGGFEVQYSGYGSLATSSYPINDSWVVQAKDHIVADPARIVAYAISINPNLPNGQMIRGYIQEGQDTRPDAPKEQCLAMPTPFLPTGIGAKITQVGRATHGVMLWNLVPVIRGDRGQISGCVGAKDHVFPAYCSMKAFLLGISL